MSTTRRVMRVKTSIPFNVPFMSHSVCSTRGVVGTKVRCWQPIPRGVFVQEGDNIPRYLPCGHVLCLSCVAELSMSRAPCPFKCPEPGMNDSTPYRLDPLDTGFILLLSTERLIDGGVPSAAGPIEKEKARISREINWLDQSRESLAGAVLVASLQVDRQNAHILERMRRMNQSVKIWRRLQAQIDHLRTQLDTGMQTKQFLRENILFEEQMIHSLQLKASQRASLPLRPSSSSSSSWSLSPLLGQATMEASSEA